MKMKKKKWIAFGLIGSLLGGSLLGGSCAYAKIIPGWDRPYDPGNYYSETSISWADTNNPSYFYRDLGWNGGNVLDVTRVAKSVLATANEVAHLEALQNYVRNKEINLSPLERNELNRVQSAVKTIGENTKALAQAETIKDWDEQDLFRTAETVADPRRTFDESKQLEWMADFYRKITETARENLQDAPLRLSVLQESLENASHAEGEVKALESNTEAEALYDAEILRKNTLLTNYASLQNARALYENDAELRGAELAKQRFTMRLADPYEPAQTDEENYERPKGNGFIRFH